MAGKISIVWDDGVKKMLSMKSLRVAFAAAGFALLLGPGFAAATIQHLDGTRAANTPPATVPIDYAYELLTLESGQALGSNIGVNSPADHQEHRLVVSPNRVVERVANRSSYVRLSLSDGMTFGMSSIDLADDWRIGAMLETKANWTLNTDGVATCTWDSNTGNDEADDRTIMIPAVYTTRGADVRLVHTAPATGLGTFVAFRVDTPCNCRDFRLSLKMLTTSCPRRLVGHIPRFRFSFPRLTRTLRIPLQLPDR